MQALHEPRLVQSPLRQGLLGVRDGIRNGLVTAA